MDGWLTAPPGRGITSLFLEGQPMTSPPLWKASVALTKAEAADVSAALELDGSAQAVLIVEEPFTDNAMVEALYAEAPDAGYLSRISGREITVEPLPDQDWIRLSQEGLPPVRAGRFFVYGAHDAGQVPHGVIPIRIEAGLAFGTGHHETTALCLGVLSELARERAFRNVLDLGTGTGLLAIGAAKLWKRTVLASDIDPVAVEVARDNAVANQTGPLVRAVVADGLANPVLSRTAPYDLVIANILAGPLTQLATSIIRRLAFHFGAARGTLECAGFRASSCFDRLSMRTFCYPPPELVEG